MNEEDRIRALQLATEHVNWWLNSMRQPLIDAMVHGYKHGRDETPVMQITKQEAKEVFDNDLPEK